MLRVRSIVGGVKNSQGISRALRSDTIHNGYQIGDYPANVPLVNRVVRNPYFYEDMQERRNFGEPVYFIFFHFLEILLFINFPIMRFFLK